MDFSPKIRLLSQIYGDLFNIHFHYSTIFCCTNMPQIISLFLFVEFRLFPGLVAYVIVFTMGKTFLYMFPGGKW